MTASLDLEHTFRPGDPWAPTLLLLHGTGGGPGDLIDIAHVVSPGSALLAPRGPVVEDGQSRWFRRIAEDVFDHRDVVRRSHQLAEFVLHARAEYPLGDRLVALGFSNGANIAAATLLLRPDALTEAVLFAPMQPLPDPPHHDLSGSRALISGGLQDRQAPAASANKLADLLRERAVSLTEHWHPGGHEIVDEGLVLAADWLDQHEITRR